MHLSSVSIELAAAEIPVPKLNTSKGWVEWGKGHGFMKEALGYIQGSPTASAMIARKAGFIAGEGFTVDSEEHPKLKAWLDNIAPDGKYRTGNKLLKRLAKDAAPLEGVALQIVWAKDGKTLAGVYHQRIETVACGPLNEDDEVEKYYLCRDWSDTKKNEVKEIAAYNPEKAKQDKVQLLVHFEEQPGQLYYTLLSYVSGIPYMQAEAQLATYHVNNVETRFALNTIISIRKGPVDEVDPNDPAKTITAKSQRDALEAKLKAKFQGAKADSFWVLYGDGTDEGADKMAKVETLSIASGETYETVAGLCQQGILSAGGVTSPMVVGLPREGGLGGSASELREAYEMYDNTVARPWQQVLLDIFRELSQYAPGVGVIEHDPDSPALEIASSIPVKFHFSEDTLANVLTDDEIRAHEDYQPGQTEEDSKEGEVPQTEAQKALSGSVGGQSSIDAMLSLLAQKLTTRESCIARLKTFFGLTEEQAQLIVPQPQDETAQVAPGAI